MNLLTPSTQALQVGILVLPDSSLMNLASVLDVMRAANRLAQRPLFHWQLLTVSNQPVQLSCGLCITPDRTLDQVIQGDLLILVAGFNQQQHVSKLQLQKLQAIMPRFHALAGIEAGSWLLARAGRLDGKQATTHWEDLEEFSFQFPQVRVKPDRFVIDGNIYTAGGASPSFDLILHLIASRYGQALALEVASVFIYDATHSGNDAQPLVSLGLLEMREPRVAKAIRKMELHIDEPLPLHMIARHVHLSPGMLVKLFQSQLNTTPQHYYLRLRLQIARRLVADTRLTIREVALRTGFNSLPAFSRRFKQHYQLSPLQYRQHLRQFPAL